MPYDLGDYIEVAKRIDIFRSKHPEGSLQSEVLRYPEDGFPFVVVKGYAYRSPDDQRPGIGLAWELVPGKTSYTRESELMNAETSAWGRAIVASLAADTKAGIASQEEVRGGRDRRGKAAAASSSQHSGGAEAQGQSGTAQPSSPEPEEVGAEAQGSVGADPTSSDFTFVTGPHKGYLCSEVARYHPNYLKSVLKNLPPAKREFATAALHEQEMAAAK